MLLLWSSVEATLRIVAKREQIKLDYEQSSYILKKLYSLGYISKSDYELLRAALSNRNSIAHGFKADPIMQEEIGKYLTAANNLLEI